MARRLIWDLILNVMIGWPVAAVMLSFFGRDPASVRRWLVIYLAVWTVFDVLHYLWRSAGLRWRWPIYREAPAMVVNMSEMSSEDAAKFKAYWKRLQCAPLRFESL